MWAVAYPYTLLARGVTEWQVAGNKKETGTPRAPLEVLGVLEHAVERIGVVDSSLQRIFCQHLQTLALSSSDHLPHQLCTAQHSPAITHRHRSTFRGPKTTSIDNVVLRYMFLANP